MSQLLFMSAVICCVGVREAGGEKLTHLKITLFSLSLPSSLPLSLFLLYTVYYSLTLLSHFSNVFFLSLHLFPLFFLTFYFLLSLTVSLSPLYSFPQRPGVGRMQGMLLGLPGLGQQMDHSTPGGGAPMQAQWKQPLPGKIRTMPPHLHTYGIHQGGRNTGGR